MSPLLEAALEQAERSDPAVRAAALLRLARVVARSDQDRAEQMLEQGIALAKELDSPGAEYLLANAICLAAAVSAKHALPLYAEQRRNPVWMDPFGSAVVGLVNVMAGHGHMRDVIAYLNNPLPGDRFPMYFLGNLSRECPDDETRRDLLLAAIRARRDPPPPDRSPHTQRGPLAFAGFFALSWSVLPRDVAATVVRELVEEALHPKPGAFHFPHTAEPDGPQLTSQEDFRLFPLLPALRHLEPDLELSILATRPELAAAAAQFPLGIDSVREGQPKFNLAKDDCMMMGRGAIIPMPEALANNFQAAFREASAYRVPQDVPKDCWPSTQEFRNILYKAGQHLGPPAEKYLDQVPDPDLRLFAQIELCAALVGLPQLIGTVVYHSADS